MWWLPQDLHHSALTPKEQFDALAGSRHLWWEHCREVVGGPPGQSAEDRLRRLAEDEEHLRGLARDQASSEDAERDFLESAHMIAETALMLCGQPGADPGVASRRVARYWAGSGLLLVAAPGTGLQSGPAMALVTASRLAGVELRRRPATRVPVLFDKPGSGHGVTGLLEVRELPAGPAGLYPDPEVMSFVRADAEFAAALASAWSYAIRGRTMDRCVVWRLTLSDESPVPYFHGGSAGAALAIALREQCGKMTSPGRLWAPFRAAFLGPRPRCAVTGVLAAGDTLAAVTGMEAKMAAASASNWRLVAPKSNQAAATHVPDGLKVYWASTVRRAARYARRWRPVRTGLAAFTALAIAGTGTAIRLDSAATASADASRALAASVRVAAQSEAFDASDPVTAAQLAVAAWRIAHTPQARASLLRAYAQPERARLPNSAPVMDEGPDATAFSPDGSILVTTNFNIVRVWNVATRRQTGSFIARSRGVDVGVCAVAFSPKSGLVASVDGTGAVRLWDAAARRFTGPRMFAGYNDLFNANCALAFSPDGRRLAASGPGGTIRVWQLRTGRQLGAPMAAAAGTGVSEVAFSPNGALLAAASGSGTVTVWSVAAHKRIGQPITDPSSAGTVAFSPDGKLLATAGDKLRFWSVSTHREVGSPIATGHGPASAVAFSPVEPIVATANADGSTTLWDAASHRRVGPLLPPEGGNEASDTVAFSPNGKLLATTADGDTRLWGLSLFLPAGRPLVASGHGAATDVAFSPDGKVLATTGADGTARLWNPVTRRQLGPPLAVPAHGALQGVAFSPGGGTVAIAGREVGLWNVATRRQEGPPAPGLNAEDAQVAGPDVVAFSPHGATMAFVSSAGEVSTVLRVWDTAAHRQIGKPVSTDAGVEAVAFSPDGTMFATGEDLQTSYLWDANSRHRAGPGLVVGSGFGSVSSVAFSPDGTTLATAVGDVVQLWDVATREPTGSEIMAGDGLQAAVTFSPDGELLATADRDGSVRLWDVATHEQIGPTITPDRAGGVNAVAFSPDAALLATADGDGTVQLINVAFPRDLVSAVCAIAGRPMTSREWSSYIPAEPYQKTC